MYTKHVSSLMRSSLLGAFALMILACSCKSRDKDTDEREKFLEKERKVLIIGIDGCMPAGITAAKTPHLDTLMADGTYSLQARNTGTTISGPSWSAMLTGVWEEKHGVTDNSFTGSNYTKYPHFFKVIKDADSKYRTVSVSQWHPINDQIATMADVKVNSRDSSKDTKNKAIIELKKEDITAMFVHFDDVDHAGHGSGYSIENPKYLEAIETVDTAIGEIMTALKRRNNYINEDWIILVSTDHGGIGTGHGGDTDEERTIFMIVSGDKVPKVNLSKTTSDSLYTPLTVDLVPTALAHLCIPVQPEWGLEGTSLIKESCNY
ncbi:alkaline phosphatase family protein [Arenibacter certesii]|uniref:Nucleotide pyrophosphatase n=1 Tax=Arenibacter certesii TaxID=228955 RepID=A0A918MQX3_9FLAO|nr:alkaline phosphatase family protein [Arenibacter certesii]GGW45976.1 nucleotide pyrophosphatase [Arenibacter certesii]